MEDTSCLTWRKSSYSGNGGANCVEAAGVRRVVLVRDTRDSAGPVLRFAPGAWRRFAEKIKRSLASGAAAPERGILPCRGCPAAVSGVFLAGRGGRWLGCRRGGVRVSAGAGMGEVCEFPVRDAITRLVRAVLAEQNDEWTESRRYMGQEIILAAFRKAAQPGMGQNITIEAQLTVGAIPA